MKYKDYPELDHRYVDVSGVKNKKLDVAYGNHPRQKMDIYYPENGEGPFPVVMFFHGGAGDKRRHQCKLPLQGIDRGYVGISCNYRRVVKPSNDAPNDTGLAEGEYPDCCIDAKAAIRYLRGNAKELNIDKDRIAIWGESMGSVVVNPLGVTNDFTYLEDYSINDYHESSYPNAVISFYGAKGPFGTKVLGGVSTAKLWNKSEEEIETILKNKDYSKLVSKRISPYLIMIGTDDFTQDYRDSYEYFEILNQITPKYGVELHLYKSKKHGVEDFMNEGCMDICYNFLDRVMMNESKTTTIALLSNEKHEELIEKLNEIARANTHFVELDVNEYDLSGIDILVVMDDVDGKDDIILSSKRARVAAVSIDDSMGNDPQELQDCAFRAYAQFWY